MTTTYRMRTVSSGAAEEAAQALGAFSLARLGENVYYSSLAFFFLLRETIDRRVGGRSSENTHRTARSPGHAASKRSAVVGLRFIKIRKEKPKRNRSITIIGTEIGFSSSMYKLDCHRRRHHQHDRGVLVAF